MMLKLAMAVFVIVALGAGVVWFTSSKSDSPCSYSIEISDGPNHSSSTKTFYVDGRSYSASDAPPQCASFDN